MHPWIERFAGARILVIGDVMLDRYYFANVTRISQEGPVPVAHVKETKNALGGAANVAHNLARLGCVVSLAGTSGDDENRRFLDSKLQPLGIAKEGIIKIRRPTTTKVRVIGGHQQMIRLDFEETGQITPRTEKRLTDYLMQQLQTGIDAVILSDYAKGVCTPGLCRSVIQACRERQLPLVVDPKGAGWQKYKGAFLVTPNLKELSEISRIKVHNDNRYIVKLGAALRRRFDIGSLLVTRSEQGLTLLPDGEPLHIPTYAQEVFDVSGAGDTVVAVMGAALAAHLPLPTAAHLSNLAAGFVVGKVGTYAISAAELDAALAQVKCLTDWEQ